MNVANTETLTVDPLAIGPFRLFNRLILGTGRFASLELLQQAVEAAEVECVTVAVRRERMHDGQGRNLLDLLPVDRLLLLPNTAGAYDADTAVRYARMGREILRGLDNPGEAWVKLEVLGDHRSLLPDPLQTLRATERLVSEGFLVLSYTGDDPILARRLKEAGATAVMPAGSPIGSGLGIANPHNISLILEFVKENDPRYPVIIDAGLGTASDAALALELGADGVLLNSAVARATDPVAMARAMNLAVQAGRWARRGGRIPRARYGVASSPDVGTLISAAGGVQSKPTEKPD